MSPRATPAVSPRCPGDMLEQLRVLPPKQLASLHFVLATNGFFSKKTRPVAEKASRAVLARFKNAKLTSKHPK